MAFCAKCGSELSDSEKFCGKCGEPVAQPGSNYTVVQSNSNDKLMGVLSYLGILCLIPYFSKGQTSFVRYHAIRGLNLFLLEVIATAAIWIISAISYNLGSVISWIVSLASLAFTIIGIVTVSNNEQKDLPIIGDIRFVKE